MHNPQAFLLLTLHGHLPWIHHPEHQFFLEEDWFFEAVADSYIPLLRMMDGWAEGGVDASITLGISPPLLSMMAQDDMRERTVRYLDARRSLASRHLDRIAHDNPFRRATEHARWEAEVALERFERSGRDLARAFVEHHHGGRVELMTCGATHGLMPVLLDEGSLEAQVNEAARTHERFTGIRPRGIWLPECGITPMAFPILARAGFVFTFGEDRSVRYASPPPAHDVYRPLYTPEGIAVFPRDPTAAKEVWSADEGYPGDYRYREFYRDLGYDADEDLLDPVHKEGTGARKQLGVKLHAITGRVGLDEKQPYSPEAAEEAAQAHGAHFAQRRIEEARKVAEEQGVRPCITTTFDCELFGHWWHEGPRFLQIALGHLASRREEPDAPLPVSAWRYLEEEPTQQVSRPAVSSWGDEGSFKVWVNGENDWLWRKVHDARLRLGNALDAHRGATGVLERALKQATREVMLAQSSDWPFIITMGTQMGYAKRRPVVHLGRAHRILDQVANGHIDETDLHQLEVRDGVFPDVDTAPFADRHVG